MRKRIAPRLYDLAHYSYGASEEARRELRALLAVYRAAKRDGGPDCPRDICRSVARMERASGSPAPRSGARRKG
jgi:hypothetical protein